MHICFITNCAMANSFLPGFIHSVCTNEKLIIFFIFITSIYILTGLIFATGLSKGIVTPIKTLINETKIIAAGDLSRELDISGVYEIEELATSFENMRKN